MFEQRAEIDSIYENAAILQEPTTFYDKNVTIFQGFDNIRISYRVRSQSGR